MAPTVPALVLLAHGSRHPAAVAEVQELADRLSGVAAPRLVVPAFLEAAQPTLPEAVDRVVHAGAGHVDVLPLFLNTGAHVAADVPRLLGEARRRHPQVRVCLLRHIGACQAFEALVTAIAHAPHEYTSTEAEQPS